MLFSSCILKDPYCNFDATQLSAFCLERHQFSGKFFVTIYIAKRFLGNENLPLESYLAKEFWTNEGGGASTGSARKNDKTKTVFVDG